MRRFIEGTSGWLFGLALTIFFVSIWGRAVVIDTEAIAESVAPLSQSTTLVDRFADWLGDELVDSGVDPALAEDAVDRAMSSSEIDDVLNELVVAVVEAAGTGGIAGSSVDVGAILEPATHDIVVAFNSAGLSVPENEVQGVLEDLDPLVITEPGGRALVGPGSQLAGRLGVATVLALSVMIVTGVMMVRSSDDRMASIRQLLTRIALGGLSFGVFLRIGSWVLDPGGGRAPISDSLSHLALAKWFTPLIVAGLAGAAIGATWLIRREIRPGEESQTPAAEPTLREG